LARRGRTRAHPQTEEATEPAQGDRPEAAIEAAPLAPKLAPILGSPRKRVRPDSTFRTLVGLVIVWASLVLVFSAHELSQSHIELELAGLSGSNAVQVLVQGLDPRVKLMMPLSMYSGGMTPRQALKNITSYAGLGVDESSLGKMSEQTRTIEFEQVALYKAIHGLIDDPSVGFALTGRNLLLYPQTFERNPTPGGTDAYYWKARLELSNLRLLIVPSTQSDLWVSLRLMSEPNRSPDQWRKMQIELWRGSELLTMTVAQLDAYGGAKLRLDTTDRVAFSVRRVSEAGAGRAGVYELSLNHSRSGPAEDAPARPTDSTSQEANQAE